MLHWQYFGPLSEAGFSRRVNSALPVLRIGFALGIHFDSGVDVTNDEFDSYGAPWLRSSNADPAAQMSWIRNELDGQLKLYRARRRRDKRKAFALQMATVALSATITVLLGLKVAGGVQQGLANVALVLGALITVLAAAEAFFGHRGLWLLRTETVRDLEGLARHLDFYETGLGAAAPDLTNMAFFQHELDRILAKDYVAWQRLRESSSGGIGRDGPADRRPV